MRAIFIFSIIIQFILTGCSSVEVAREVTKATKSIETSVKKLFKSKEEEEIEQKITIEKQEIIEEQEKISEVVTKQKKVATLNLSYKTMKELKLLIGEPQLIRNDGNTTSARFDSKNCRLFVFMDSSLNKPRVEYYELRNDKGEMIENQKDIELCFNEIKII